MHKLTNQGIRLNKIKNKIEVFFRPIYLEIKDNSKFHRGHKNFPEGLIETHFEATIISEKFKGIARINRHRMVTDLLEEEFNKGLHALELRLYSPQERNKKDF
mgnify:CR=1 FL=1